MKAMDAVSIALLVLAGLVTSAVAIVVATPFAAFFFVVCLLGVWKSHGGIGPRGGAK